MKPERVYANNIHVFFSDPGDRTNWCIDADAVTAFYHSYEQGKGRYLKIVAPDIPKLYEGKALFTVYNEDTEDYVALDFDDVVALLKRKDRDVSEFAKSVSGSGGHPTASAMRLIHRQRNAFNRVGKKSHPSSVGGLNCL